MGYQGPEPQKNASGEPFTSILLYVEDDEATALLFRMALQDTERSIELVIVPDFIQAEAFLRHKPPFEGSRSPNLVVLDLNLDGVSGFSVLEEIRHSNDLQHLEVVVFSSSKLCSDQEKAFALGAKAYVTKPAELKPMWQAVAHICTLIAQN